MNACLAVALTGLVLGGCGNAADEGFAGAPSFTLAGEIAGSFRPEWADYRAEGRLLQALFWTGPGIDGELETSTRPPLWPLDRYRLHLFGDEPIPGPWAAGRFEIYLDEDGDGRRSAGDTLIAGMVGEGLLFAAERLSPEGSPTGHAVSAGVHVVPFPMACGATAAPRSEAPCDLPLGEPCGAAPCPGGLCTSQAPRPWTGATCLLEGRTPGCTPTDAVWIPGQTRDLWVPACATDADCPGPEQACVRAIGGCLSTLPPPMRARPRPDTLSLRVCAQVAP